MSRSCAIVTGRALLQPSNWCQRCLSTLASVQRTISCACSTKRWCDSKRSVGRAFFSLQKAKNFAQQIIAWFETQRRYAIYSSSVLLVFEGDHAHAGDTVVDARMIDFTHVFDTSERDDNYLDGVRSLTDYLQRTRDVVAQRH